MKTVPHSDVVSYYVDRPDRRALDLRAAGVPEGIVLGRSAYRRAYPPLPEHRHFGVAELAYVETGHQPYDVGGRRFTLSGGEGVVIPPDTPHSSDAQPSYPGRRFWLQLQLPAGRGEPWLGLSPRESAPLLAMLKGPTHVCAKWPSDFADRFETLFELFDRPASAVRTARLRTALLGLLFDLLDLDTPKLPAAYRARVKRATDWAEAHLAEPVSIERLAAVAGLSASGFKHAFKAITGISPHAYLLRKRVERARALLGSNGGSVTDVALACGFPSSQYFATVFKRVTGLTPNDVLRNRVATLPRDADGQ